jgi:hypothetical protein
MKIRYGFVSNSSSCSFIITNTSNKRLSLVDFVKENPQLVEQYFNQYEKPYREKHDTEADTLAAEALALLNGEKLYTQNALLRSAKENNFYIQAGEEKYCIFGDEDGTLIGQVFDYILRDGGESANFKWTLKEMLR